MNYYKRHLGDYAKDAGHLTMTEHGAFTLLLDRYYSTEKPLTTAEAMRVCRARSAPDREIVEAVLREFFVDTPEGWRNKRADKEIAAYNVKADRNREAGKLGGRPPSSGNPNGFQVETQTVSEKNPSHKPLATSQKEQELNPAAQGSSPASPKKPGSTGDLLPPGDCPHAEIIAAYHEALPGLRRVRTWDERRQSMLRKRWREDSKRQSLGWWQRFFAYVATCPFLVGKVDGREGGAPFEADLEWLLKPSNFAKVIEGRYQDKSRGADAA